MTNDHYYKNLQRLGALDPANLLLNKLHKGPSLVNCMLLAKALGNIEINPPSEQAANSVEEETDDVDDVTLKSLRTKQRKLFSDRAIKSDLFHQCKNNTERAYVSEDIQVIQRNIEIIFSQIRHYKQHGVLPEDDNHKEYLPKDGILLQRKMLSIRADVSRQKKIVSNLEEIDSDDLAHLRKLEKAQERLVFLKRMKKNAEQKIKNLLESGVQGG